MSTPSLSTSPKLPSLAERIDPAVHAALARASSSLSLASPLLAWLDWSLHLAVSPGKRADLSRLALQQVEQWTRYAHTCLATAAASGPAAARCVVPPAKDRRFEAPEWQHWPFNLLHQSFLLTEQWWGAATQGVWGVEKHHQDLVNFVGRQLLDLASPGNQLLTNPVVLAQTQRQLGANLARGVLNAVEDMQRAALHAPAAGTDEFQVGRDVAVTPGKVVLKTRLMELIQYTPSTPKVHPEPVLIVPAWIMKYYILDLSPHNSLIKYLVDHGHTVFCISWKNPQPEDRDLGMGDYLSLGVDAALAAVREIVPAQQVHGVGYCLGGTLLTMAAAALARREPEALASMTLFAAQTDFSEPGELGLFIDENQVSLLEAQMDRTGYLQGSQMAGAFQMLRSNDLLWSRVINEYLLGERPQMNDLMAWNTDATNMPARMHSQYLRQLFLKNDLAEGRFAVDGHPVSLTDLRLPVFVVGTVTDHVAPWRSVYKLHHLSPAEITFALTSGGHNAGVVNPPEPGSRRHFQLLTRPADGPVLSADDWLQAAPTTQGSWWPAWQSWLAARSGAPAHPPQLGGRHRRALADAPGSYVLER